MRSTTVADRLQTVRRVLPAGLWDVHHRVRERPVSKVLEAPSQTLGPSPVVPGPSGVRGHLRQVAGVVVTQQWWWDEDAVGGEVVAFYRRRVDGPLPAVEEPWTTRDPAFVEDHPAAVDRLRRVLR